LFEQLKARLAVGLGAVHRGVGIAHECVGAIVSGRAEGDADARGREHFLAIELERGRQLLGDPLRHANGVPDLRDLLEQDGELVATETRRGVLGPQTSLYAFGRFDEQLVSGLVPQAVVDHLKIVQVEKKHRRGALPPSRAGQGVLEPVHE